MKCKPTVNVNIVIRYYEKKKGSILQIWYRIYLSIFLVAAFNRFVKCWYTRVLNRCSVPDFDCNTIKMSSKATVWGNIWNGILRAQKSSLTTKYGTLGIRIIFHLTMLSLFIPSICQISWYLMKLVKSEHILKLKFYDTFLE